MLFQRELERHKKRLISQSESENEEGINRIKVQLDKAQNEVKRLDTSFTRLKRLDTSFTRLKRLYMNGD
jgi:hypothetical protein